MEQNKTHWKKNNDSRYISGEDLKEGLRGLKPEMIVTVVKFSDADSFDQQSQQKITVTGLFLQEVGGKELPKPVILNNTNAKVLTAISGSPFMEDWTGKPVMLFAQADKRHGYVVRFRKYNPPVLTLGTPNFEACKKAVAAGHSIDQIKLKYSLSAEVEQALKA